MLRLKRTTKTCRPIGGDALPRINLTHDETVLPFTTTDDQKTNAAKKVGILEQGFEKRSNELYMHVTKSETAHV